MSDKAVRAHFHSQADACDRLGSAFTARLCRLLGERLEFSTKTGSKVLGWSHNGDADPRADALALLTAHLDRVAVAERESGPARGRGEGARRPVYACG